MKVIVKSSNGLQSKEVELEHVTKEQYTQILANLRERLETSKNFEAITASYIEAIRECPQANPSDLWRYLIYRPYLEIKGDQSWKRAGGQALENAFSSIYNPLFAKSGIRLVVLSRSTATSAFTEMGIVGQVGRSKLDIVLLGRCDDHTWRVFGGLHVKASIAERISDDVPASQAMMNAKSLDGGYYSALVTLDMKAFPPPHGDELNRGELQFPQKAGNESDKRNYFERDGFFHACFSYNLRTPPTPLGRVVAASIFTLSFSNTKPDIFMQGVIAAWTQRSIQLCLQKPPSVLLAEN
jgi:BsaWI restriction endonuclease type 2